MYYHIPYAGAANADRNHTLTKPISRVTLTSGDIVQTRRYTFASLRRFAVALAGALLVANLAHAQPAFITFESGQVRPLVMNSAGTELFALNTPDGRLEIFNVGSGGLSLADSIPVGMEPVALALRNDDELWVVNHLSDSVSIVDLNTRTVTRTLLVGDEPRDIVFAGTNQRAFITTAHRGQHRIADSLSGVAGAGDPQFTTPGVSRADLWVFDAGNPGAAIGGVPVGIVELFGDTPRALAVSPDGNTVYAAVFHSGNQTATVTEGFVCDGFDPSTPCGDAPGGNPGPAENHQGEQAPETGLIVKWNNDDQQWQDELGRDWGEGIKFTLPDQDVFAINANTLAQGSAWSGVGTILFNMVLDPVTGNLLVSNTDSVNEVRFEGAGGGGSTVQGHLSESSITVLAPGANPKRRHLNKHINYALTPAPADVKEHSLATPTQMVVSSGGTVYVAAFGSSTIGVIPAATLSDDTAWDNFDPTTASSHYLPVPGGGPAGLALDEARNRLYVLTRFNNAVLALDLTDGSVLSEVAMHNPEPAHVITGRPLLYDARLTSSNGEASCAACHIYGDLDSLAWDLGDPDGDVIENNPLTINLEITAFTAPSPINGTGDVKDLHPMKGPMTTQTLRGLVNGGAMHWRGDRAVGPLGTDATDTTISFNNFNPAFPGLLGRTSELSEAQMNEFTAFALEIALPPNPVRNLDNALTAEQQGGFDFYFGTRRSDGLDFDGFGFTCNGCHVVDAAAGAFGNGGAASFESEPQIIKISHLRNLYQKVGMFGMPPSGFINNGNNGHQGEQIRGFGFLHDGSVDTIFRFFNAEVFDSSGGVGFDGPNNGDDKRRQMEQYMLAFDTDLAPIVGQQITLSATSASEVSDRIDLLLVRSQASFVSNILGGTVTECDVVVKGVIDGKPRGARYLGNAQYLVDDGTVLEDSTLRSLATNGEPLTFTCQPPGSGARAGVDRDLDGISDALDNCPALNNVAQSDTDGDDVGNLCDNCSSLSNAGQRDTDGDGFGNLCDGDFDNDGQINFNDLAIMKDAFFGSDPDTDLDGDGNVNFADLSLLKSMFFSTPGPGAGN